EAARARALAAAAHYPGAFARPAGGFDPGPARGARLGERPRRTVSRGGDCVVATERRAQVTWRGSLLEGSGQIGSTTSGAFGGLGVTWQARSENEHGGLTSPEELIAAAHAACFSMALSAGLARAETPAEKLNTSATVTFQPGEGITRIALAV